MVAPVTEPSAVKENKGATAVIEASPEVLRRHVAHSCDALRIRNTHENEFGTAFAHEVSTIREEAHCLGRADLKRSGVHRCLAPFVDKEGGVRYWHTVRGKE